MTEYEVLRCGKLLVENNSSAKWKYRFIALKIGEEQGANLEVYKIKKNDDVVFSFHIELGGDAEVNSYEVGNKFVFSCMGEVFASFDASERNDWVKDINEYKNYNVTTAENNLQKSAEDNKDVDISTASTGGGYISPKAASSGPEVAKMESKVTAPSPSPSSSLTTPANISGTDPFDLSTMPSSAPWAMSAPTGSAASSPFLSNIPPVNNTNNDNLHVGNTVISSPQQPSLAAQTAFSTPSVNNRSRARPLTTSSFSKQDSMGMSMGPRRKGEAKIQAQLQNTSVKGTGQALELSMKSSPKTQFTFAASYNGNDESRNSSGRKNIGESHSNSNMTTNTSKMESIVSSSSRYVHGHMNAVPLTTSQPLGNHHHFQQINNNSPEVAINSTSLSSHEVSILVQLNAELNESLEAMTAQHQYEKDVLTQQIGVYKHDLETLQEVNAGLVAELRKANAAANRFPIPAQLHDEESVAVSNDGLNQQNKDDTEDSRKDVSDEVENHVEKESEVEGLQRMLLSLESVNRELMIKMQNNNDLMVEKELMIADLQEKLSSSMGSADDVSKDREALEEKINHLELQYERIQIDNEKQQEEAKLLRGIITDHENTNKQLKTMNAMQISEAKNREQALLSWKVEYETISADKDRQIAELQKLRDQALEVEKLQAAIFIEQEERAKISDEMEGVRDLYTNTQEELQQTHTQLRALLKENNRLAQEDKIMREKVEGLKSDLSGKEALHIDNNRLSTEISVLKNQLEALRNDIDGKELGNAARFDELQRQSSAEIESMRNQLHEIQSKLSEAEFKLMESETNLSRETTLKTSYMEQRDHMEKRLQAEIEALREKSQQVLNLESENSALKISMVQFEQMSDQSIEELSTQNRKLSADMAAAHTELEVTKSKLQSHTKTLLELESELDKRTKSSSEEKMDHLKQINALDEGNKQYQRRINELEVSSTTLTKVQTEEIQKLTSDLSNAESKLQAAESAIHQLQIQCDMNEKRLMSEHNVAAEEKARRLEEHAAMEKERAKRLSELAEMEAEKLQRIAQLEEEKSKRLAEHKQLEIEQANRQALEDAERKWAAHTAQLRARNDELEVLLEKEKSRGLAEHKQYEVEHANRQSLENIEKKLAIEVDGLRERVNELDIELSTTKISLNDANLNRELSDKKSKELEVKIANSTAEHENRLLSLQQESDIKTSELQKIVMDTKEQLKNSIEKHTAKIKEYDELYATYEGHDKYYRNIIQCSNVVISSILDGPQVLPPALKGNGVDDLDFHGFANAIKYVASDKSKVYQGDILVQQLHKLFLKYRLLDRTCKDVTTCIKAEYDFVEFVDGVGQAAISEDVADLSRGGNIKATIAHASLDHVINNLEILMKQYNFARQREIEQYELDKNMGVSWMSSPTGGSNQDDDSLGESKTIRNYAAEIERNKQTIAKMKVDHEEHAAFLQQEMERALNDQKRDLSAKFETELEQLKAQMGLEYHDYIEQASATTPLKSMDADDHDNAGMLQSELSNVLNDYRMLKTQYDEVIGELDACIAALELVEKQKMDIETENLELKHRIKTMKARFPDGSFSALQSSNVELIVPSGVSESDGGKINYATNGKVASRGKLSAPLSPGLMSRISNIANRASKTTVVRADSNRVISSPSSNTKGSKPSDLLRLADLS